MYYLFSEITGVTQNWPPSVCQFWSKHNLSCHKESIAWNESLLLTPSCYVDCHNITTQFTCYCMNLMMVWQGGKIYEQFKETQKMPKNISHHVHFVQYINTLHRQLNWEVNWATSFINIFFMARSLFIFPPWIFGQQCVVVVIKAKRYWDL